MNTNATIKQINSLWLARNTPTNDTKAKMGIYIKFVILSGTQLNSINFHNYSEPVFVISSSI